MHNFIQNFASSFIGMGGSIPKSLASLWAPAILLDCCLLAPPLPFRTGSPHCSSVSLQKPLTGPLWSSSSLVSTQQSGWGFSNVSQSVSLLSWESFKGSAFSLQVEIFLQDSQLNPSPLKSVQKSASTEKIWLETTSSTEMELITKNLPIKNTAGQDNVTGEFYQILKEKILSILHKIFQKVEEEQFPTHSNKTSATLI